MIQELPIFLKHKVNAFPVPYSFIDLPYSIPILLMYLQDLLSIFLNLFNALVLTCAIPGIIFSLTVTGLTWSITLPLSGTPCFLPTPTLTKLLAQVFSRDNGFYDVVARRKGHCKTSNPNPNPYRNPNPDLNSNPYPKA